MSTFRSFCATVGLGREGVKDRAFSRRVAITAAQHARVECGFGTGEGGDLLPGLAVQLLAQDVQVAVVPGGLFDHVQQDPA